MNISTSFRPCSLPHNIGVSDPNHAKNFGCSAEAIFEKLKLVEGLEARRAGGSFDPCRDGPDRRLVGPLSTPASQILVCLRVSSSSETPSTPPSRLSSLTAFTGRGFLNDAYSRNVERIKFQLENWYGFKFRGVFIRDYDDFIGLPTKTNVSSIMGHAEIAGLRIIVLRRSTSPWFVPNELCCSETTAVVPQAVRTTWTINCGRDTKRRGTHEGKETIEIQRLVTLDENWSGDLLFWPETKAADLWNSCGVRIFLIKVALKNTNCVIPGIRGIQPMTPDEADASDKNDSHLLSPDDITGPTKSNIITGDELPDEAQVPANNNDEPADLIKDDESSTKTRRRL